MDVRVIALHVACQACGATSRLTMQEQQADWWGCHLLPVFTRAEVLVDGQHRYLAVQAG